MEIEAANPSKSVDVRFHSSNREQRSCIEEARNNGWLSALDHSVLNGCYDQVDANRLESESIKEARSNAYALAEKKLISYTVYCTPDRTIELGVSKYLNCNSHDVVVLQADLVPCTILGKPAYKFTVQTGTGASDLLKGEVMILDTLARFVFS